jgi:hypothetical protein
MAEKKYFTDEERREASRLKAAKYRRVNRERHLENRRKWTENNKDRLDKQNREYREANKVEIAARCAKWYKANKDKEKIRSARWLKDNKDRVVERNRRYRETNKEKVKEAGRKWSRENPVARAAIKANRRARELSAKPIWAKDGYIKLFYRLARIEEKRIGGKVHVDHIVPLAHPKVCGLHCEDNLQLLTAKQNMSKSNTFDV